MKRSILEIVTGPRTAAGDSTDAGGPGRAGRAACRDVRREASPALVEQLEDRRYLSAAPASPHDDTGGSAAAAAALLAKPLVQHVQHVAPAAIVTRAATTTTTTTLPRLTLDVPAVTTKGSDAIFRLVLSDPLPAGAKPASIAYTTRDGGGRAGVDYKATSGIVTFQPGETMKTVRVPTLSGAPDKSRPVAFSLQLTQPPGSREPQAIKLTGTSATTRIAPQPPLPPITIPNFPSPVKNTYSPFQIRHAYGFDQFNAYGYGTTIAIVDAYGSPSVRADLTTFSQQFGLPLPTASSLKIVNQRGTADLPDYDSGWAEETALDVQWVHAIAPQANILLVQADSASAADLAAAAAYAKQQPNVVVVTNSYGAVEADVATTSFDIRDDRTFNAAYSQPTGSHPGVTFVFSSGDHGEVSYQCTSPNVLAVGGTSLVLNANGDYLGETVWNNYGTTASPANYATGGGVSKYVPKPNFQAYVSTDTNPAVAGKYRGVVDVAFSSANFPVYESSTGAGWQAVGGTSASAPCWAGLLAIADGIRMASFKDALANAQVALYALPSSDFNDIVTGNNKFVGGSGFANNGSGYSARFGYDLVSGLGTPKANLVIQHLIDYNGPTGVSTPSSLTKGTAFSGGWVTLRPGNVTGGAGEGSIALPVPVGLGDQAAAAAKGAAKPTPASRAGDSSPIVERPAVGADATRGRAAPSRPAGWATPAARAFAAIGASSADAALGGLSTAVR